MQVAGPERETYSSLENKKEQAPLDGVFQRTLQKSLGGMGKWGEYELCKVMWK